MNNKHELPRYRRLYLTMPIAFGLMLSLGNVSVAYSTQVREQSEVAQSKKEITGIVIDISGEPLIGVNIKEKGSLNATITNVDGKFRLNVKPRATLVVSYMGHKSQEIVLGDQTSLRITLHEDTEKLGEVVVIGYGTIKKADLAGSVSVMDNKAFKDQPITNISDALQGRMAGVNVVSDGLPGGSVKVRIRGTNSINKNNEPLYVVDGIVRESGLDGINPEDIHSMQALKDASSTAIYGSRGANGVVIIKTKTGMRGQSNIVFDASVGISKATRLPKIMDTKSYAQALIDYAGINRVDLQEYLDGTNPGIDWVNTMYRTGVVQNYKLAFSKGKEDIQTYISANYMKNQGILEKSSYERYSVKANVKATMTKWLDITLDANASRGKSRGIGGLEMSGANPLWIAYNSSPTMVMKDSEGNYNNDPYGTIQENAYASIAGGDNEGHRDVLNGRADLCFKIAKGLTFTTTNGIDYFNNSYYGFSPKATSISHNNNSMVNINSQRMMLQSTNNFTYTNVWNDKHHLMATAVWEATQNESRNMSINGQNIQVESVGWWDVQNAKTRDCTNGNSAWSLLSGVGRVIYNYDNKYLLTGTLRADGSSRFSKHKWGYFPSIASAWTISNEKFMEKYREILSNLKIRASYGVIGNQDIAPYSTLDLLSPTSTFYGTNIGVTGYWGNTLASPDIRWEKTKQFDLGLDVSFLNGRFDLSIDYFNKQTSDALLSTRATDYLGGYSYLINAGKVANQGVDISLTANIFNNKDFGWSTTINGTYLKNEVKKLTAQEPIIYGGSFESIITECSIIKEGESIGTFFGYKWAGIDKEGYDTYYTSNGNITRTPSADDRVILGKSTPDFTLGWNNSLRYKNWSLNAFFNAAFGVQRLNALRFAMNSMIGNSRMFTDADFLSQVGKTMPDPRVKNNQYIGNSSKWVENASYFRCENITLAYNFPKSQIKFADLRLSLSVQNLFTLTGYKGANPSSYTFSSNYGDRAAGIDTGTYPTPRTFTFGLRMTF